MHNEQNNNQLVLKLSAFQKVYASKNFRRNNSLHHRQDQTPDRLHDTP